ncbi:MAG: site-specific DNA-methyltransferase, partial [Pseudorhodoplanes sp.]
MASQGCISPTLVVESVPLSRIVKNKNNAREHKPKQIEKLAQSIRKFGFLAPVVVDQEDLLLCGHARVDAAQQVGMTTVPVIRVDHLSEVQKRAFMIADNRLAELALWDEAQLKKELQFLTECDIDFDFSAIGFETPELDIILNVSSTTDGADDGLPQISPDQRLVSKPGSFWRLGDHRVYCGNALQPASYHALLRKERAQLVFADPPYNVRVDGHVGGLGVVKHREFPMASGEMNKADYTVFLGKAFEQLVAFTTDGAIHFVCMDWRHVQEVMTAGMAVYSEMK